MWKFLFYIFLAYMLYQLVFNFILPVYRTTRQVKKGFREMQDRMNEQMQQQQGYGQQANASKPHIKTEQNNTEGEYIDFEEVK
jgi:Sec-independent protein translocase protein TatA